MNSKNTLHRGLTNRHVQLIALGSAVGTGLFLGSASAIQIAGPAVILCYAIAGLIAFFIMRQLGEMMAQEPISGSFSALATKYWGEFPGLLSGWNYWVLYVLVGMTELTAVSVYINFWFPNIPQWEITAFFFFLVNAINLMNVKVYGEMEFWFASFKLLAIIAMILFGIYMLVNPTEGNLSSITNLWSYGGFFAGGLKGFIFALSLVLFSFGGLELVGIAAAETDNPEKTIPKATNQIIYRILIFYIGALTILLSLYPWNKLSNSVPKEHWAEYMAASPFVQIFQAIGVPLAAHILNFVVLTAALSVYNSCVYANSRMLHGLATQKNAPAILAKTDARGVPFMAIIASSLAMLFSVFLNYSVPEKAVGLLLTLVVSTLLINWAMIIITHLKFRKTMKKLNQRIIFPALWVPVANYICLAFVAFILWQQYIAGQGLIVILMPIWVVFIWSCYKLKNRKNIRNSLS